MAETHPKTAFVYPGQGALEPGKIKRVLDSFSACSKHFDLAVGFAEERLEVDLGRLMLEGGTITFNGEEVEINDTRLAQPATLIESTTGSIALAEILGRQPDLLSYHSMGLIAALHDRGVYDTPTAVDLAIERGESMYQSFQERPGAMAAIFGQTEEKILALCRKWGIAYANDNSHTEKIVSGHEEGIEGAAAEQQEVAEEEGGKKPIKLKVPGGAHSDLVASAGARMSHEVERIRHMFSVPEPLSIFSSRTLRLLHTFEDVRADIAGLPDRVYWRNTILKLADDGYQEIYEPGPGSKLSRLPRKDPIMADHLKQHGAFIMSLDQLLDKIEVHQ